MVLIQEVSVRDQDWSTILTIMPGAASFAGAFLLVEHVHPPLSWRFPVSLVLFTFQGQKAPPLQGRGCMPPRPQASI
jgi:hypothetical protein